MNRHEAALVLDALAIGLGNPEVPEEAVEMWARLMAGVDPLVAAEAVDLYLLSDDPKDRFFPTVGRFQVEVGIVHREHAIEAQRALSEGRGANRDCEFCGGYGWGDVAPISEATADGEVVRYKAVRPCSYGCNPVAYQRWLEYREEAKRGFHRRTAPVREWDFDVAARIRECHEALDPKVNA